MDPFFLALGLTLVDYGQTRTVASAPAYYHEYNPLLGKHPSMGSVNKYFLLTTAGQVGLHYALPQPYRDVHAWIWAGTEGACVVQNIRVGIRISL
jgi:hypothetical protein